MEARSLTALNNLAGNPPQYPINPAQEKQDPLTLYISRVPGTRDVILSPFKPQLKNVTAEDVASCLYYVHFEAPSLEPAGPPRDDEHRSSSDESSSIRNIKRKPLPGGARPLTPPPTDHLPVPGYGNENQDPTRRRGLSVNSTFDPRQASARHGYDQEEESPVLPPRPKNVPRIQTPEPAVARKPLGPRMTSNNTSALGDHPLPPLPPPNQGGPDFDRMRATSRPPLPNRNTENRSPSPRKSYEGKQPFTLALIRRDPSTGNQWNVGHISSFQCEAPPPDQDDANPLFASVPPVAQPPTSGNPPINVQIETLGYGKFRGMPARRSFDAGPGSDMTQPRDGGVVLQRQVAMAYGKSWASNWREKLQDGAGKGHGRQGSVGSIESTEASSPVEPAISMHPGPGLRPRGYIFTSPWNGRCEFRTGAAGRSLRCYHILHDDRPSNPLAEFSQGQVQGGGGGMPMSELRFNLPTAELFKSAEGREEVKTQLQGHFNKLLRRDERGDSYDNDGMVSPFDINLGKEKAGGGNRGKRAKLGKLIIYPDGLKMLDLLVSANMGLWWQAWEKSF
ncbi:oxidoreductase [Fusarium mexicanum]|uniref:Oxidoreductase n=1 Tax=Fusarium mexicanum TaxID=751941 RepID=A0A8H5N375_9HYPO|nr:oxidoreductase [Fusarium mexicanum]